MIEFIKIETEWEEEVQKRIEITREAGYELLPTCNHTVYYDPVFGNFGVYDEELLKIHIEIINSMLEES